MKIPWLLPVMLCFGRLSSAADLPAAEVRPIREIQTASTVEPFKESQVSAEGVVTWVDGGTGLGFYIQDPSGGLLVTREQGPGPKIAERVRVRGMLARGDFAPVIGRAEYQGLGPAALPYVVRASGGGLLNGSFNGERVETDGWIRSAEMTDATTMIGLLDSGASRISFRISNVKTLNPEKLIAAKAWVRGVASPVRSRGTIRQLVEVQLLVNGEEDFRSEQRETASPWELPTTPLRNAFQYHPGQTRGERLHVRGKVIHVADGVGWLHDGDAGLAIRGKEARNLKPGEQIQAVGFRDLESFLPVLSDVVIRPDSGPAITLQAKDMPAWQLQNGLHHADFVAVSGHLLDRIETPAAGGGRHLVLALQSPRGVFTAELNTTSDTKPIEPGSLLRVAGICLVQTDAAGDPVGFKMALPDPASITVLEPAPYFTVRRMLILLSVMLGVLLLAALAGFFLARRNASLRAEVRERQAVASERGRLARDLHDTLEQGLTGIQLQIHGIGLSLKEAPPQTRDRLAAMRQMVQHCHTEVRQSIWDLRAEALEHFDLGEALHRMAQSHFLGSGIRVEFKQQRGGGHIPGLIGDNLLRIGQEAMTNVLKHSQAGMIGIDLTVASGSVTLTISDDGRGLADRSPENKGGAHFGLVGMDERAERIGGRLSIGNRPGGGALVRIEVPLPTTPSLSNKPT
ncbi:histidine kinase [Luteolibacter arcticus]|uniref:Histidine kinase n=1 Tax=Luteolibacter arcticus TaxID=1581411 RepID=A0ABT3GKN6_9BACT|nr:histidine kinase [Luteolibacter arcticus]MCW1924079.1 histidine kinase [Luteolibacter arcticus]